MLSIFLRRDRDVVRDAPFDKVTWIRGEEMNGVIRFESVVWSVRWRRGQVELARKVFSPGVMSERSLPNKRPTYQGERSSSDCLMYTGSLW